MSMLHRPYTVKEAAHYFKVRPKTIRAWIVSGKLAASKIGKSYRIDSEEINRVMGGLSVVEGVRTLDPERLARIEALRAVVRNGGVTQESFKAQRSRDFEREISRLRELGRS